MKQQREVDEEYNRFLTQQPTTLSSDERRRIGALAENVSQVWNAEGTSAIDRKQIVRCVVERVILVADRTTELNEVTIMWKGGMETKHAVSRPVGSFEQLKDYRKMTDRIRDLHAEGLHHFQIADTLNREGFVPPRRRGKFTKGSIGDLIRRLGLAGELFHCLDHLLKSADEKTGYIGNSMYNHGFAALALAEAYGTVQDERIAPALQKAIKLILTSQEKNKFKAWRYTSDAQDADSTVSGACFVALIAARNAGLRVPDAAVDGALKFYSDCQTPGGGAIGYVPGSGGNGGATTAIGVAAYAYARKKDQPTFTKGAKALKEGDERPGGSYPFYYEYYAAQAFFQSDVKAWEKWNEKRVKELTGLQNDDGSWDGGLGAGISTGLGLLSIAPTYRYLPIYER